MRKLNNKIKRKLRNRKKLKDVNLNRYRISVTKSLRNILNYLDNINVQHNLDHENAMTEACANMNKLLNNTYHLKLGKGMLVYTYQQ